MRTNSKKWLKELSNVLTPVEIKSTEYEFFAVAGFDPEKYLLAVYKQKHTDCWQMSFQDPSRPNVWLAFGHIEDIKLSDVINQVELNNSWRNDIKSLMYGYETPVQWILDLIKAKEAK